MSKLKEPPPQNMMMSGVKTGSWHPPLCRHGAGDASWRNRGHRDVSQHTSAPASHICNSVRTQHLTINVMWHFKLTKAPSDPCGEITDYEADCDHSPFSPQSTCPGHVAWHAQHFHIAYLKNSVWLDIMKCWYSKNVIISWNVEFLISSFVTPVLYLISIHPSNF